MARTKAIQTFKAEDKDTEARIIESIGKVGPRNVAQIARMVGVHQETVRYKTRKRFQKLGFRFQANVDFGKLGLTLHWGTFRFSKGYERVATQILRSLNKSAYLVHFSRILPQGHFVALFALPPDYAPQLSDLLGRMKYKGILADFALDETLVERHLPMDPSSFNFRSGRWEIEWEKVKLARGSLLPVDKPRRKADFDFYDLLLIKELQNDAVQHVVGIARKLKVSEKTLEYHYRTHVVGEKLIPSYRTRWMQDTKKTLAHSVVFTRLTFRGLSPSEFDRVQKALSKVPFLWAEDLLEDGTYIATLSVPLPDFVEFNAYLSQEVPDLGSKVEIGFLKVNEAGNFTVPHHLYKDGRWTFDLKKAEQALRGKTTVEK